MRTCGIKSNYNSITRTLYRDNSLLFCIAWLFFARGRIVVASFTRSGVLRLWMRRRMLRSTRSCRLTLTAFPILRTRVLPRRAFIQLWTGSFLFAALLAAAADISGLSSFDDRRKWLFDRPINAVLTSFHSFLCFCTYCYIFLSLTRVHSWQHASSPFSASFSFA